MKNCIFMKQQHFKGRKIQSNSTLNSQRPRDTSQTAWVTQFLSSTGPNDEYYETFGEIHSSCSLHYNRYIISFKRQFAIQSDLVLLVSISSILYVSLMSWNSCLLLLPRLPVTSILSSIHPSMFQKAIPTQDVTNPVTVPSFYCLYGIPLLLQSLSHFFISHTIYPADILHPLSPLHFKTLNGISDLH